MTFIKLFLIVVAIVLIMMLLSEARRYTPMTRSYKCIGDWDEYPHNSKETKGGDNV